MKGGLVINMEIASKQGIARFWTSKLESAQQCSLLGIFQLARIKGLLISHVLAARFLFHPNRC